MPKFFVKMRIRIGFGAYQLLLILAILVNLSECIELRLNHLRLYKNYHHKFAIYKSFNLKTLKTAQNITQIAVLNSNYFDMPNPVIQIYKLPLLKFVRRCIPTAKLKKFLCWNSNSKSHSMSFEKFQGQPSLTGNNSGILVQC